MEYMSATAKYNQTLATKNVAPSVADSASELASAAGGGVGAASNESDSEDSSDDDDMSE